MEAADKKDPYNDKQIFNLISIMYLLTLTLIVLSFSIGLLFILN